MRYELSTYEWSLIRPMLPNKPRGVPCVDDLQIQDKIANLRDVADHPPVNWSVARRQEYISIGRSKSSIGLRPPTELAPLFMAIYERRP